MSDSTSVGAYASAMSQSLYDQGKAVGRMIEAAQRSVDISKQKITDNALTQIQNSIQAKDALVKVGSKLNIYA